MLGLLTALCLGEAAQAWAQEAPPNATSEAASDGAPPSCAQARRRVSECAHSQRPEPEDSYALALGLRLGWGTAHQQWALIGNAPSFAAVLSFESDYFLSPVLQLGYSTLASEQRSQDLGPPFGVVEVENSLSALDLLLGPAIELGPVRLVLMIGLSDLMVESKVAGREISPDTWVLAYAVELDGWVWGWDWGRLGLFTNAQFMAEAQLARFGAGLCVDFELGL
jgi:hypothetical protein